MIKISSKMKKTALTVGILILISAMLGGCSSTSEDTIKVGSKEFTEQLILGQITILALEDAGFDVEDKTNVSGSDKVRSALTSGDIDVYWEYTGTAWLMHLQNDEPITDSDEAYALVKEADKENDLIWLDYAPFDNTYTIMMRRAESEELGIKSLSDLSAYVNENPDALAFGVDHEFTARPDGFPALEEAYDFKFTGDSLKIMDGGIIYRTLKDGQVNIGMGTATDGRIAEYDFVNLEDDRKFFPVYNPSAVVRKDALDKHPEMAEVLNKIAEKLDNETMIKLNFLVAIEEMEPKTIAKDWLEEQGLID